jgi:hypothetical protein
MRSPAARNISGERGIRLAGPGQKAASAPVELQPRRADCDLPFVQLSVRERASSTDACDRIASCMSATSFSARRGPRRTAGILP